MYSDARQWRISTKMLRDHGYSDDCVGCDAIQRGRTIRGGTQAHTEQCRQRLKEAMSKNPVMRNRFEDSEHRKRMQRLNEAEDAKRRREAEHRQRTTSANEVDPTYCPGTSNGLQRPEPEDAEAAIPPDQDTCEHPGSNLPQFVYASPSSQILATLLFRKIEITLIKMVTQK